jgi:hypothetical protein
MYGGGSSEIKFNINPNFPKKIDPPLGGKEKEKRKNRE